MGGALAVSFASYFPQLVSSLVLIAPGGLKDSLLPEYRALPIRFPKLFPKRYVKRVIRRLLNGPDKSRLGSHAQKLQFSSSKLESTEWPVEVQQQDRVDVTGIVDWEIDRHQGFIFSVTSALRSAPITCQYNTWCRLGSHINVSENLPSSTCVQNVLQAQKVLLLLGSQDPLVPAQEVRQKATLALGASNLEIIEFKGGHAFPIIQDKAVADTIWTFWQSASEFGKSS